MRNKAAEKAKHVHQHQPQSSSKESSAPNQQSTNTNNSEISSSTISGEHRTTSGYSINGILGIQQADSNGNNNKKKRIQEQHGDGECIVVVCNFGILFTSGNQHVSLSTFLFISLFIAKKPVYFIELS